MASRFCRLVLTGWRRGLLHSGRPQGARSVLRNRLALRMLVGELAGERMERVTESLIGTYGPHIDPKKLGSFWHSIIRRLAFVDNRAENGNDPYLTVEQELGDIAQNAGKIFASLKRLGVLDLFDKKATERHNELDRQRE